MTQQIMQEEQQEQPVLKYEFQRAKDSIRIKDYKIPVESFSRHVHNRWGSTAVRRQKKHTHFSDNA